MKKVQISIPEETFDRMNIFAKKVGVNRSALICLSVNSYIDAQEQLPKLQLQLDDLKILLANLSLEKK